MNHTSRAGACLGGTGGRRGRLAWPGSRPDTKAPPPPGAGLDRRPLPQPGLHPRQPGPRLQGSGGPLDYTISYDQLSREQLRNYDLFLCLRDGMIWPGGYLGPDAYTDYEQKLENQAPQPKSETWITGSREPP